VCISDTHNKHRDLVVPDGDILIHAGDFTLFGKEEHAQDFNTWLGTLPHKHKIVVNGNHENNADWKDRTATILTNATFLRQGVLVAEGLKIFGCEFFCQRRYRM
jgi:predicted phosphohydrolase